MRPPTPDAPLYLTKATLKRSPDVRALVQTLLPSNDHERALAAHRLVWSLFGDDEERVRDFLWRELAPGEFFTLSERPPPEGHAIFDVCPAKAFAPALSPGDRLAFSLRANPTLAVKSAGKRGKPVDVVMHAKHRLKEELGEDRGNWPNYRDIEGEALAGWLANQGARYGFAVCAATPLSTSGYQSIRFRHRAGRVQYAKADLEGLLTVTDPTAFLAKLAQGFGRAKSYGCGLMLIRRA